MPFSGCLKYFRDFKSVNYARERVYGSSKMFFHSQIKGCFENIFICEAVFDEQEVLFEYVWLFAVGITRIIE